jgi:hypothetical protein
LSYPKGRRGAKQEVLNRRARALLKDLIADRDGQSRIARIQQELSLCWTRGYANACQRGREPPDGTKPA